MLEKNTETMDDFAVSEKSTGNMDDDYAICTVRKGTEILNDDYALSEKIRETLDDAFALSEKVRKLCMMTMQKR